MLTTRRMPGSPESPEPEGNAAVAGVAGASYDRASMAAHSQTAGVDELLDQAGDAVASNDWELAKKLAEVVLRQTFHHPEAELVLRTANAYLETERTPGHPLSTSRDLRFMSLMFCDVVGSTRMARDLGDALWRSTLERFRRRCARAVRRYDGYVHEASGDELLILFGYPRVREDDARRAVLAGLDIVAAIQSFSALLEREHGFTFQARVGIHTGRALIRERDRSGSLSSGAAEIGDGLVGDAANIAKRVETAAKPNTVWVSSATRRIVEGFFEFGKSPDGERRLELGAIPGIAAYQVNRPTAALNRHQIARVRSDEMIGRLTERERLLKLWEQAKTEGAPFVVVSGQAGIGKSRLVEFLAESAAGSRASRLECICTEILRPVAFAPLIGLLERFANIRQADSPETRLSKLDAAFRDLAPEFAEFVPYLAWMMSIPRPDNGEIDELEPEVVRNRIFDNLLKVLTLVASFRPSVLWIEDVQWADHSMQEFCRRLEAHGPIPGLIVVATMRTDHVQSDSRLPWSDRELAEGSVIRIELDALSPEESRKLIAARSGSPPDDELARAILESTGGNPLYIEEVVRSVVAGGDARQKAGDAERTAIAIPESLQPIFAQIVDRLGDDRHVAQMASLLGRELPEPLTRAVIASILGLTEDGVVRSLARLIDAEIIEPILTELSPGYRFRHELIREALVHSVGPDAKENHGRIARAIEQSFPDTSNERPELLAYHFARAAQHERAAAYRLSAGVSLQAKAAHQEAIASFDLGLDSLSKASEATDRTARARLDLALRASRGVSVQTTRGYADERAGDDWARAYELSKELGAEGALVPALLGLWSFYFVRGDHKASIDVASQIVDAADVLDDLEASLIGHVCLGYSKYFQGDLTAGRLSLEHSWQLHDKVKDRPPHIHVPQDPGLAGLNLLGPVRWSLGDQVGGIQAAEESHVLAAALESRRAINLARIGQTNAWLHQIRGDYQKALSAAEQALVVAREFHFDWAVVNLSIHKGLAMAHLNAAGRGMQEGAAIAKENLGYWRAGGAETMVPYFLGELAAAYHRAGENAAALDLLNEAIELGDRIGEHCHDAELYRVRGQVKLAGDDSADGLEDLLRAIARAREQRAVSFEIRSTVRLLAAAPQIPDRETWMGQLEGATESLQSSEDGQDERDARKLRA
jgi:class 3 adenylate cyclase/tetratricopeptide (TPR) repeat protein